MHEVWRDDLRALLRRVSEVRGLSDRSEAPTALAPGDGEALMHTLRELADDLERSHRRLIEANIQLVSLREVASSLVGRLDHGDTTKTVTRYLTRAFAFDDAFLLLLDRENARLTGTWTHRSGDHEHSDVLEIPLLGGQGALARSLWLNRTVVQRAPRHHVPAALPHGHPLQDVFHEIGHLICVPLQRSHPVAPATEAHELCGARCILGDAALFAPPPPPDDQGWTDGWDNDTMCFAQASTPGTTYVPQRDGRVGTCGLIFGGPHTAGIQVVLCDGSVRSISYGVNANAWLILCQASSGAVLDWSNF